jgi:hypothetical protein
MSTGQAGARILGALRRRLLTGKTSDASFAPAPEPLLKHDDWVVTRRYIGHVEMNRKRARSGVALPQPEYRACAHQRRSHGCDRPDTHSERLRQAVSIRSRLTSSPRPV